MTSAELGSESGAVIAAIDDYLAVSTEWETRLPGDNVVDLVDRQHQASGTYISARRQYLATEPSHDSEPPEAPEWLRYHETITAVGQLVAAGWEPVPEHLAHSGLTALQHNINRKLRSPETVADAQRQVDEALTASPRRLAPKRAHDILFYNSDPDTQVSTTD